MFTGAKPNTKSLFEAKGTQDNDISIINDELFQLNSIDAETAKLSIPILIGKIKSLIREISRPNSSSRRASIPPSSSSSENSSQVNSSIRSGSVESTSSQSQSLRSSSVQNSEKLKNLTQIFGRLESLWEVISPYVEEINTSDTKNGAKSGLNLGLSNSESSNERMGPDYETELNEEILRLEQQVTETMENIRAYETKIKSLTMQNNSLQDEKEIAISEAAGLRQELISKTNTVQDLQSKNRNVNVVITKLKKKIISYETEVAAKVREISSMKAKMESLKETEHRQKNDLVAQERESNQLSSELDEVEQQLATQKKQVTKNLIQEGKLKMKINELNSKLQQESHNKNDIRTKLTLVSHEIEEKDREIRKLTRDLQKMGQIRDKLTEKIQTLQQENKTFRENSLRLKAEAEELKSRIQIAKNEIDQNRKMMNSLNENTNLFKNAISQLNSEKLREISNLKRADSTIHHLNHEIDVYLKNIDGSQKKLIAVENDRNEKLAKIKVQSSQMSTLVDTLQERDGQIQTLCIDNQQQEAVLATSQRELENMRNERNQYAKYLDDSKQVIQKWKKKVDSLTKEIEILSSEVENKKRVIQSQKVVISGLENTNSTIHQKNESAQTDLRTSNNKLNLLNKELLKLRNDFFHIKNKKSQLQANIDTITNRDSDRISEIQSKQEEIFQIKRKLDSSNADLINSEKKYNQLMVKCQILENKTKQAEFLAQKLETLENEKNEFQKKLNHANAALLTENTRILALQKELNTILVGNKTNEAIGYKRLKADNPKLYQSIQRFNRVQAALNDREELLSKTEGVVEAKTKKIAELDRELQMYKKMYNRILGQQDSETSDELDNIENSSTSSGFGDDSEVNLNSAPASIVQFKQALKTKNLQVKNLKLELSVAHKRIERYQNNLIQKQRELLNFKQELSQKLNQTMVQKPQTAKSGNVSGESGSSSRHVRSNEKMKTFNSEFVKTRIIPSEQKQKGNTSHSSSFDETGQYRNEQILETVREEIQGSKKQFSQTMGSGFVERANPKLTQNLHEMVDQGGKGANQCVSSDDGVSFEERESPTASTSSTASTSTLETKTTEIDISEKRPRTKSRKQRIKGSTSADTRNEKVDLTTKSTENESVSLGNAILGENPVPSNRVRSRRGRR